MRTDVLQIGTATAVMLLSTACMMDDDATDEDELPVPTAQRFDSPGLHEGDFVVEDGIGMVIPPPGYRVDLMIDRDDGVEELTVANDEAGTIRVTRRRIGLDDPVAGVTGVLFASPGECSDGAYTLNGGKWTTTLKWGFYAASTPGEISVATAESALKAATANITGNQNTCGFPDRTQATTSYSGRIASAPNVGGSTTDIWCGGYNTTNSVGFGTMPSGILGATCSWTSGSAIVAADIKFNKYYYRWSGSSVPAGCTSKYVLESTATHEFGHAFGLGHVSETYHGNLTMSTHLHACTLAETTLGMGDVRALQALY